MPWKYTHVPGNSWQTKHKKVCGLGTSVVVASTYTHALHRVTLRINHLRSTPEIGRIRALRRLVHNFLYPAKFVMNKATILEGLEV